ncbi:unnamed protein product [Mesocestoides corti]|uniref:Histone-lysine N-methyltransferase n=1 Tax=Mesocestoides corti TaxID=53468 RepID=A0A0R3U7M1_MESCO|nr:unnamed protein product [Mesocestoides corti]
MDSKTNDAQLFLSSVSGVPNRQTGPLFASRHATHPQIPVSLPANFAVVGDNFSNCTVRPTISSCKRKPSASPPAPNDRSVESFSNGSPAAPECRSTAFKSCVQAPSPVKRPCQNSVGPVEARAIAAPIQHPAPPFPSDLTNQVAPVTVVNNVLSTQPCEDASSNIGVESVISNTPSSTDHDRSTSGKLEQVIDHVLELARSDEPHEDVFVLPVRTREFIPMPSPLNQGSTPSSSLNTSPPVSPSSSPRLISPAFSNSALPPNSMVISTHSFPRCAPIDQFQGGLQLHQRPAPSGNGSTPGAMISDLQRERFRLQPVREPTTQVPGPLPPSTVAMLMKTTPTADSVDTSFMQSKGITQGGYFDPSSTAVQPHGYGPRQIVSKVSMAVADTKITANIVPVQSDIQKQSLQQIHQQNQQHLQPRVFAYIPQRQIYDSTGPVFTVPTTVQPRPNISTNPLAVKKESTLEFVNQASYSPHTPTVPNGVTQVASAVKQVGVAAPHAMQYADMSKSAIGPVAGRKRSSTSSKRKKSNSGHQPITQGTKVTVSVGQMAAARNPLVAPSNMEFTQLQPPPRQTAAVQEILNKLMYFDSKKFLSDPVMEAFSCALPPLAGPTCTVNATSTNDESWLKNCGAKYKRCGLALKTVPPTTGSESAAELGDLYLHQRLLQPLSRPTMQGVGYVSKIPDVPSRVCVSPKPVTFENRMQSFFTSIRQSDSPHASTPLTMPSDAASSVAAAASDSRCSILQMLKTPCPPLEGPAERKTPPLPLCHIPNTCLLRAPSSQKNPVAETNSSAFIDCETGEVVASRREPVVPSFINKSKFEDGKARVIFTINPAQFEDVPRLLQYICSRLGINPSCVTYAMTNGEGEITFQSNGSTHFEDNLREFEAHLRQYFPTLLVRMGSAAAHEKVEDTGEISSQMKLFAELQKEKSEDPSLQMFATVKHKEEPISVASILSSKRPSGEYCRVCNSVVPQGKGLRRKLDEIAGAGCASWTIDHGYHCSDVLAFCSDGCLDKFGAFLSSCTPPHCNAQANNNASDQAPSVAESRHHPHQLVFGGIPGTIPVLLQHLPHKSLKLQTLGRRNSALAVGKRKVSPKQKRWRDVRWRVYRSDLYHTRKFATVPLTPAENETNAELHRTTIRDLDVADLRSCILCGSKGDASVSSAERLLCLGIDRWIHLNCALWCYEIYESVSGSLHKVDECIDRALKTVCSHCGKFGAGLPCYNPRCSLVYHVPCAIDAGCMFFTDRGMYCPNHQPRDPHPMQLTSLTVSRKVYLTRDEGAQVASVIQDEARSRRVRIGSVILHNVGQLLPHQIENENFHSRKYIYPVNFLSTRIYWSMRRPGQRALYHCEIKESNGRPLFQVTSVDKGLPDVVLQNEDCNELWKEISRTIRQLRQANGLIQNFPDRLRGEDMFGLSEPQIVRAVESLPGVDNLVDYAFHFGRLQLIPGMPLAINPSGCARSEPNFLTYLRRKRAFVSPHEKSPTKSACRQFRSYGRQPTGISTACELQSWNRLSMDLGVPKNSSFTSWSHQYRHLKREFQSNVAFGRSRIQGFGLFAAHDLEQNTIVIEYIGELIRLELANKREKEYESRNRGIYMFRLEDNMVIDATMCGGPARYINHSCQPNCFTKYVNFDNEGHIVIVTKRKIEKGEELTYDYQFDLEDRPSKIPCLCGAVGCRKWMN